MTTSLQLSFDRAARNSIYEVRNLSSQLFAMTDFDSRKKDGLEALQRCLPQLALRLTRLRGAMLFIDRPELPKVQEQIALMLLVESELKAAVEGRLPLQ